DRITQTARTDPTCPNRRRSQDATMSDRLLVLPALLLCTALAGAAAPPRRLPPAANRPVDFTRDIRPILERTCLACHGPDKQRASLRLDDGSAVLKGGDSGAVVKPGDSAGSVLVRLVAGLDPERSMPPGERKKLNAEEIGLLRAWIDQGATVPKETVIA